MIQNNNPKISVIVPVYNTAPYLRQCLDSLINQTMRDIEIICINDASTDNSLEILNEYAANDSRITIISFEENKRQGTARNAGLRVAKGEYVGFVDSDDWVETDMYEKLWNASLTAGAEVSTSTKIYNNRGDEQWTEQHLPFELSQYQKDDFNKYIIKNASAAVWMLIIKKELFFDNQLFFAERLIHEDVPIAHALYCCAHKVSFVDQAFYHYRQSNKDSITHTASDNRFDLMKTCVMYLENMKRLGLYDKYKEECDYWFYTRYYHRMMATCFFVFPSIRKDYIEKIKNEFPRYVENIRANKYYRSRKITRFDILLWLINRNTGLACFLFTLFKLLKLNKILEWVKALKRGKR